MTSAEASSVEVNKVYTAVIQDTAAPGECGSVNGAMSLTDDKEGEGDTHSHIITKIYHSDLAYAS